MTLDDATLERLARLATHGPSAWAGAVYVGRADLSALVDEVRRLRAANDVLRLALVRQDVER